MCDNTRLVAVPRPGTVGSATCETPSGTITVDVPAPGTFDEWAGRVNYDICDSASEFGVPPVAWVAGDTWTVTPPENLGTGQFNPFPDPDSLAGTLGGRVITPVCDQPQ
jgi:hypothetical protein